MELVTAGLGAGSYPEPQRREENEAPEREIWLLFPEYFQEFSDMQEFPRSFEGETWRALSEREQREIIRNAMKIYSSAWDCERWKKEYLRRHCREYGDYLRDAGITAEGGEGMRSPDTEERSRPLYDAKGQNGFLMQGGGNFPSASRTGR